MYPDRDTSENVEAFIELADEYLGRFHQKIAEDAVEYTVVLTQVLSLVSVAKRVQAYNPSFTDRLQVLLVDLNDISHHLMTR